VGGFHFAGWMTQASLACYGWPKIKLVFEGKGLATKAQGQKRAAIQSEQAGQNSAGEAERGGVHADLGARLWGEKKAKGVAGIIIPWRRHL
jgi:hypothetical protein